MKKVVDRVKFHSVKALTRLVLTALENASLQVASQAMKFTNHQLPPIREEAHSIAERFLLNMNASFDRLNGQLSSQEDPTQGFDETALDGNYFEAVIAMEGMINHARNCDISQYLSFGTRLNSLFENLTVDETNNPLDPEQIGNAFTASITPMGLRPEYLLTIYREFNKAVFHNLEEVLLEANEVLIDLDILPDLSIKARDKEVQKVKRAIKRPTTDAETRAFANSDSPSQPQIDMAKDQNAMFAMMRSLLHKELETPLPLTRPERPDSQTLEQSDSRREALSDLLEVVQKNLLAAQNLDPSTPINRDTSARAIIDAIGRRSEQDSEFDLNTQQVDIVNLIVFTFESIWQDDSLPSVMKELIGSTQVAVLQIALADISFFSNEQHPARILLNEFAMAGIAWTEPELLLADPMYMKVKTLSEKVVASSPTDSDILPACIQELREFKTEQTGQDENLEQSLKESGNHSERLEDVHKFVTQKINERVLNSNLDPSIRNVLDTFMHEFLVKLVLKEGPGGSSWKPVMSTIDVLIWTVKAEKHHGDRERFDKINPRLIGNLTKALEIGGASKSKLNKIIRQLKQVQEYSFHIEELGIEKHAAETENFPEKSPLASNTAIEREKTQAPRNDPYLRQIDKLPIGVWLEFKGTAGTPVRCTLAAKIASIDKMFFVNRQGVKVIELTRARLAQELKAGSVKIISEGSLVDRAIESVISKLRESAKPSASS